MPAKKPFEQAQADPYSIPAQVNAIQFIWSVRWGAGCVERYDPDGKLTQTVTVPARFPTSVAFGGNALNDLYITSALLKIPQDERNHHPYDGDLFRVRTDVEGRAEPTFAG